MRLHRAKRLALMDQRTVTQDFTFRESSYLNMKVIIFAKDENMEFF